MNKPEEKRLHHISNVFSTAFESSVYNNCDSYDFARKVMTTRKIDWLFSNDDVQDWCDGWFLFSVMEHELGEFKKGKTLDKYVMQFAGYLYKYWMNTRHTSRYQIYDILPLERLVATFDFYHTQGWDYIIEDAIKTYKEKSYIV